MNAIGAQLHDLINSELIRSRLAVWMMIARRGKRGARDTRFRLGVENELADAEYSSRETSFSGANGDRKCSFSLFS